MRISICVWFGIIHTAMTGLVSAAAAGLEFRKPVVEGSVLKMPFSAEAGLDLYFDHSNDLKQWNVQTALSAALAGQVGELSVPREPDRTASFYRARTQASDPGGRPNIVFIYTDDQAPWALGASGDPNASTPVLDKLFRDGAYLKNSFTATPVCSPSRASLMTSRYGSELGITDWINAGPEPDLGLDPQTITWPELLQSAGYRTGLVGKWHLGDNEEYHPTRTGYDYFMGFRGGGTSPENPTLEKNGVDLQFEGYTADVLGDHALEFIEANADRPFLLSLHFRAPHAAWLPVHPRIWNEFQRLDPVIPNPDYPNLDIPRVERMTREYLASVATVDWNVGRVLQRLDELKLTHKTIVIFTSDHGYNMGHNGIWHKGNGHWVLTQNPPATQNIPGGQRPNMYDNSIKTPTAIRWPGVIAPGTVIEESVTNLDWFPTLLALAGVEIPEQTKIRGRNFVPLLLGETVDWNNDVYGEYSTHHQSRTHMRMHRTPEWKLIRDFLNPGRDELYHLAEDPAERVNLVDAESAAIQNKVAELHEKILQQMRLNEDPVLELINDNTPPQIIRAASNGVLTGATVEFDQTLDKSSAAKAANYSADKNLNILGASLLADGKTVSLTTSRQTEGLTYILTINGVRDASYSRNPIEPDSQVAFVAESRASGGLLMERYDNISGTSLNALYASPKYPSRPDLATLVEAFEIPTNAGDDYGVRLRGFISPPRDGNYIFYISSDDAGALFLSSDDHPENLEMIASDPQWNRPRIWIGTERRDLTEEGTAFERPVNVSRPIPLKAEAKYAVEALMKDGSGGDCLGVAWRLESGPPIQNGDAPIQGEYLYPAAN